MPKVLVLLLDGSEMFEAAAFHDVFGWSNSYGEKVEMKTVSVAGRVTLTFGLQVETDLKFEDVDANEWDGLAVAGGFGEFGFYEAAQRPEVMAFISQFQTKEIAAICTGAFPLVYSGILRSRKATTYHMMKGLKKEQLAQLEVDVQDDLIVEDENIITSSCPGTAADVALRLLAKITSLKNADHIREIMGF